MTCRENFLLEDFELFNEPERILISGFSGSGKSYLTRGIINRYHNKFDSIVVYGGPRGFYANLPDEISQKIVYFDTLIDPFSHIPHDNFHLLYIIDDLQLEAFSSSDISRAFRTGRHHNLSIILLAQTIFCKATKFREITLNLSALILLKSRDLSSVELILRQIFGRTHSKKALEVYKNAMKTSYGHILVDLKLTTPIELMIRSNILQLQYPYVIVYQI